MFTEVRPTVGDIATTPEMWAANFRRSAGYTLRARLSIRFDSRWKLIQRYFRKGGRVLDAGCGFGEWVEFLCRGGYRAEGLDYSDELIARLRAAYPHRTWTQSTTQAMSYPDASFDGIISWGVIEHDPNGPADQLREFLRVLKPGGRAIVTVPNDSPTMRKASALQYPGPGRFFQFFYTPDELSAMLSEAKFRVLKCGHSREVSAALLLPRTYARTGGADPLSRALRLMLRLAPFIPGPTGMIYGVCEKP
jgi:ubiquinone/menaquinone biosynthesis C-methylase UbiE